MTSPVTETDVATYIGKTKLKISGPLDIINIACILVENYSKKNDIEGEEKKKLAISIINAVVAELQKFGYISFETKVQLTTLLENEMLLNSLIDSLINIWNSLKKKCSFKCC